LSRDPIEEDGGVNLYTFNFNNPLNRIDPNGKESWIPFPTDPSANPFTPPYEDGIFAEAMSCAENIADELRGTSPFGEADPSARWEHCVASCRISRECPGGRLLAWIAGDWAQDPWFLNPPPATTSDPGDRAANLVGRRASCTKNKTCEEQCTKAFNEGKLYPVIRPLPNPNRPPVWVVPPSMPMPPRMEIK
jgi:hypothetical protein